MNDLPVQPAKLQPAMVHIDLSNALPSRAFNYLSAFLPGLFFVISLALAVPTLINNMASNIPEAFSLSPYIKSFIILFLAFVIGNGFMMGVTLIQWLLRYPYRWGVALRRQFYLKIAVPVTNRLIARKNAERSGPVPRWLANFNRHGLFMANELYDMTSVSRGLYEVTRQLLEIKLRIKLDDLGPNYDWHVFSATPASPTAEETRGKTLLIATHATGWCGLVASRLAPVLRNRYYISFCGLLITAGLLHDLYVAINLENPVLNTLMNIRGLVRQFPKLTNAAVSSADSDGEHP